MVLKRWLASLIVLAAGCSFPEYSLDQSVTLQTCRDDIRSGNESDIDCGGACDERCAMGMSCSVASDCASSNCEGGVCVANAATSANGGVGNIGGTSGAGSAGSAGSAPTGTCSDGIRNQSESDVDCGGNDGCMPCATGKVCDGEMDCDTALCVAKRCQPQTCGDGLLNQDEGDVDCGGESCNPCQTGQHCQRTSDCDDAQCSQGICQSVGCTDKVKNGDESGLDCGGSCSPCADFIGCRENADCRSGVCNVLPQDKGFCLAATCNDGVLNGEEPSIDCGSSCERPCGLTQACFKNADCTTGNCDDGKCVPAGPTGAVLPTTGWTATASHTFNQSFASKALDGNGSTMWESGAQQSTTMWFRVDMQTSRVFYGLQVVCTSNNDQFRQARVLISDDGTSFTAITGATDGQNYQHFNFVTPRVARYIKIELTRSSDVWWRIDELRVTQ